MAGADRGAMPGLMVRYSGSEDETDGKFFRQSIRTRLVFLNPPLLSQRFEKRRDLPLQRPKIEWGFVNGNLPIKPPVLYEGSDDLIHRPDPPFSDDRTR